MAENNWLAVLRIYQGTSKVIALNMGSFFLVCFNREPTRHVVIVLLPEMKGIVAKR